MISERYSEGTAFTPIVTGIRNNAERLHDCVNLTGEVMLI